MARGSDLVAGSGLRLVRRDGVLGETDVERLEVVDERGGAGGGGGGGARVLGASVERLAELVAESCELFVPGGGGGGGGARRVGGARGDSAAAGADERAELLELVLEVGATRALGVELGRALGVHARDAEDLVAERRAIRLERREGGAVRVRVGGRGEGVHVCVGSRVGSRGGRRGGRRGGCRVRVRLVRMSRRDMGKPWGGRGVPVRGWACGVETHTLRTTRTIAAHLRAHAIHRRRDRAARRGRGKVCSEGPTSDLKRAPTAERFDCDRT